MSPPLHFFTVWFFTNERENMRGKLDNFFKFDLNEVSLPFSSTMVIFLPPPPSSPLPSVFQASCLLLIPCHVLRIWISTRRCPLNPRQKYLLENFFWKNNCLSQDFFSSPPLPPNITFYQNYFFMGSRLNWMMVDTIYWTLDRISPFSSPFII